MKAEWDVAVVGGGFAGSIAACLLAHKGLRVVLLERGTRVGRETRSGNVAAVAWWRTLGAPVPGFIAPVMRSEVAWLDAGAALKARRPIASGELFAFRREDLDRSLAELAAANGVACVADFGAEEVCGDLAGPAYVRSAERMITAEAVVVACGADEPLLLRSGFIGPRSRRYDLVICHQRLSLDGSSTREPGAAIVELAAIPGFTGAVGYLLRLEDEVFITITMAVRSDALAAWEFRPQALLQTLKDNPFLAPHVQGARITDWRARAVGPLPALPRRLHRDRVVLIGDAALPLGGSLRPGHGFRWAHFTAREASQVLARAMGNPTRLFLRSYAERVAGSGRDPRWTLLGRRLSAGIVGALVRLIARRPEGVRGVGPGKSLRLPLD